MRTQLGRAYLESAFEHVEAPVLDVTRGNATVNSSGRVSTDTSPHH